jgi:hypothetical protein
MPTTTNNGWTIPADTDLVKNGASAIRTLGNAIDTTLGVYAGAGLVKLNTQTFTTASSISFPNNTFTSTYNNYFFTFNCTGSTAVNISARLRVGGVDNSSANYNRANWESVSITSSRDSNQTSLLVGETYDSTQRRRILGFTLCDPQVSGRYTSGLTHSIADLDGAVYPIQRFHGVAVTTSYDSITFLTNTGTITGSITCYGYAQ